MKHDLDAGECPSKRGLIAHTSLVKLDIRSHLGQVGALAGREIVEDAHPIAAREQRTNQRRSDEPRATGDETGNSHGRATYPGALQTV